MSDENGENSKKISQSQQSSSHNSSESVRASSSTRRRSEFGNSDAVMPVIENDSRDILNFFADYEKLRSFLPYMPTVEAFVYMKIPPDGGYAWVILIVTFLLSFLIDGILFSVGRILPTISEDLNIGGSMIALMVSLQIGLYYASGPISGALANKIGFRKVTMIGAVLSIVGTVVGSFSNDIISLMIFFGILVGFGFGMAYLSAQMIVGFYFEKYRGIACGLCSSGSGLGVLFFSPFHQFLVINVGWRNTLRCQCFFSCVIFVLAIFYRPVQPTKIGKYIENSIIEELEDAETFMSTDSVEISYARYSATTSLHNEPSSPNPASIPQANIYEYISKLDLTERFLAFCCFCCKHREVVTDDTVINRKLLIEVDPMDREDIFYTGNPKYEERPNKLDEENITVLPGKEEAAKAINYTMSVTRSVFLAQTLPNDGKHRQTHLCSLHPKIVATLGLLFDKKLLRSRIFQYLLASSFLFLLGTNIPYIYITNHVQIPEQHANLLLSTIGFTNVVLRISSGFIAFYIRIDPLYLAGIPMIFCGISTFLCGFIGKDSIAFSYLFCIIFGIGIAFSSSLKSIIFVELLGLDKLTNAYGLSALANGIGAFIGTTLAGVIISVTGKTDYAFVFSGIGSFLSGVIYVVLPFLIKKFDLNVKIDEDVIKKVRFKLADAPRGQF